MMARDRMSRTVRAVLPDLSVWSALSMMRQEEIRHLLVIDGERLVGVISNRDYRRVLERARPDGSVHGLADLRVSEIMTPGGQLVTARPDTPILEVARLIVTRKVGCIPVLDAQDRPVGILTQKDVMAALVELITSRQRQGQPAAIGKSVRGRPEGGRRVLVVDDEPQFREVLVEYLEGKGFEALGIGDGAEALRQLPEFRPQLVLLDISMPGLDGVETLRRLKALAPETSVVMVSSSEDLETARQTLAMGAADYVSKPVDYPYLDSVLETHLLMDDDAAK